MQLAFSNSFRTLQFSIALTPGLTPGLSICFLAGIYVAPIWKALSRIGFGSCWIRPKIETVNLDDYLLVFSQLLTNDMLQGELVKRADVTDVFGDAFHAPIIPQV